MKKLYTLSLALMSFCAVSANNFTVYHDGKAVANGETIVVSEPHNTSLPIGTKYEFNADLQFEGEAEGDVTVTGVQVGELKDSSGLMAFSLCPTNCTYLVDGVISNTFAYQLAYGKKDLQLHLGASGFLSIEQPIVYAELDMTVGYEDSSDVLSFKLIISNDPASVTSIAADTTSVSFANNALTVNSAKASTLEVFSTTGSRVKAIKNVKNQTVDLSGLHTGLYIYRFGTKTGKIIIRK